MDFQVYQPQKYRVLFHLNVTGILFRGYPYTWLTTVRHDTAVHSNVGPCS